MHPAIIIGTVRSLIVDVAVGQIPRSTEHISSFYGNWSSGFRGVVRQTYTRNLVSVAFSMRDIQYQTCLTAGFDKQNCTQFHSRI